MPKSSPPQQPTETRRRLLDAAGEVFAEKGFRSATVREICRRARANVAAVNYYFGDKETLYEAVLRHAHRHASERSPLVTARGDGSTPAERLKAFVEWLLLRVLGEGRPDWQARLLAREMLEPSRALDSLVETEIRPVFEAVEAVCRELLGAGGTVALARFAARSVFGQCFHYHHAAPILSRLHPDEHYATKQIHRLAEDITEFSLAGIERLANPRAAAAPAVTPKREP